MDRHELIVQAAAQIASGMLAATYGKGTSEGPSQEAKQQIVALSIELAGMIEQAARKEPETR